VLRHVWVGGGDASDPGRLAALAAHFEPGAGWLQGNLAASRQALATFPGLQARFERLRAAELALRADQPDSGDEARLRRALQTGAAEGELDPRGLAPLWIWLLPVPGGSGAAPLDDPAADLAERQERQRAEQLAARRRVQRQQRQPAVHGGGDLGPDHGARVIVHAQRSVPSPDADVPRACVVPLHARPNGTITQRVGPESVERNDFFLGARAGLGCGRRRAFAGTIGHMGHGRSET